MIFDNNTNITKRELMIMTNGKENFIITRKIISGGKDE